MDFLLDLAKIAAPIIGNILLPGVGGAIGTGVSGLIGSFERRSAANEAEQRAQQAAAAQRQLAMQALGAADMTGSVRNLAKEAVGQLGGSLGAAGLLGSSLADNALAGVVGDVVARLAPARANALMQAYQLGMTPEQNLFNMYSGAAGGAAQGGGLDFGWLADLGNFDWSQLVGGGIPAAATLPTAPISRIDAVRFGG